MATHKQKYQVGDYVYEPYAPQNLGKVMKLVGAGITKIDIGGSISPLVYRSNDYVEIKFLNGKIKQISMSHLADFNALIADHQKKLQTHTSKLPILAKL